MKKNIDELSILQVDEFQDYQVADVVEFACLFPHWNIVKHGMINAIKQGKVHGKTDFELLSNAYEYAYNLQEKYSLMNTYY